MSTESVAIMVTNLLKAAGHELSEQDKKILEHESVAGVELPEALVNQIYKGTIGIHKATQHPDVRKAISKEIKSGIETGLRPIFAELLPDTDFDELRGDPSANPLPAFIGSALRRVHEKAANSKKSEATPDSIKTLEDALKQANEKTVALETQYKSQIEEIQVDYALNAVLSKFQLADAYSDTRDEVMEIVRNRIKKSAALKLEAGKLVAKNPNDPQLTLLNERNEAVTVESLAESVMSKFVKKADTQTQPSVHVPGANGNGNGQKMYNPPRG